MHKTFPMMKEHLVIAIMVAFTLIFAEGCEDRREVLTIGVAANPQRDMLILESLGTGLTAQGYVEGKSLAYIYENIIVEEEKAINAQVKKLLSRNIDVLFVVGAAGGYVREVVKGTDMPVIFCGDPDPVGNGMVTSLIHPGGNITGVTAVDGTLKTLEWLTLIKPGLKKVWMPYDPDDPFSSIDVSGAEKASTRLGITFSRQEVHSAEETVEAIKQLPADVDAVFINPSRALFPGSGSIIQAAIDRGLPTGSSVESVDTVLVVVSTDFLDAGKKAARLAHQIFQGIKPSELPVETPESVMTINLKTAKEIGLSVPDEVLVSAKKIIR